MKIYNRDVKSKSVRRFRRLKDGQIFDNDAGRMFNMDTPNNRAFVKALPGSDGDFLRRELARQDNGIWRNPGKREPGPMRNPIVRKRASLQDAKVIPTPVRQEPTQRMAGDSQVLNDIDTMLRVIREDEIGDEIEFYKKIKSRQDNIDNSFLQAGVSKENINNVQLVGNITDTVPEAFVQSTGSTTRLGRGNVVNEDRFHTDLVMNELTGQTDVVPFIADGESKPLVTRMGMVGKNGISTDDVDNISSDEFLAKRVMQLAGLNPVQNNQGSSNFDKQRVDFKLTDGTNIDAEVRKKRDLDNKGTMQFQMFTELNTPALADAGADRFEVQRTVENLVKNKMEASGLNIKEAIDALGRDGVLINSGRNRFGERTKRDYKPTVGKMYKKDPDTDGPYADQIVYPVMDDNDAANNLKSSPRGEDNRLVQPLEGAYMGDMNAARRYVESASSDELLNMVNFPSFDGYSAYKPIAKAVADIPVSNSQIITDLSMSNPRVRQLFYNQ